MPRLSIDYSKTIMYRIVCKDPTITDCYVGSTTDFTKRKNQHKYNCNNKMHKKYNLNVYKFIREHNGWDNFNMLEIEKYNAIDKADQSKQERYWLENFQATLNIVIPSRTDEEYREQNKEQIAEKNKEFYEQNKEQILEKKKEYREKNKEQIAEKNKEFYEQNKEQILEKRKEYREKNKEQIKEKKKEKITCVCGSIYNKNNLSHHLKSKKHQSFLI